MPLVFNVPIISIYPKHVIGPEEREIEIPQELEKLNRSFPLEQKAIKKQKVADATAVGKKEGEEEVLINECTRGNHVLVSVKDTGSGIDPEMVSKLFSKFTTKSLKGTGLGLFICKSIVESHGGRIWAENNNHENGIVNRNGITAKEQHFLHIAS